MKKFIVLLLILIPVAVWGFGKGVGGKGIAAKNAGGGPTSIFSDNFDGYSTGELAGNGGWTEEADYTNTFMVSIAQSQSGANSFFVDNSAAGGSAYFYKAFTPETDDVTVDMYVYVTATEGARILLSSNSGVETSKQAVLLETFTDNDWQYYDGAWHTITSSDWSEGWNHIKIIASSADDNWDFYISDMETPTETSLSFRNTVTEISALAFFCSGSGSDMYIDNISVTK